MVPLVLLLVLEVLGAGVVPLYDQVVPSLILDLVRRNYGLVLVLVLGLVVVLLLDLGLLLSFLGLLFLLDTLLKTVPVLHYFGEVVKELSGQIDVQTLIILVQLNVHHEERAHVLVHAHV